MFYIGGKNRRLFHLIPSNCKKIPTILNCENLS
jgi:hypothetical protein